MRLFKIGISILFNWKYTKKKFSTGELDFSTYFVIRYRYEEDSVQENVLPMSGFEPMPLPYLTLPYLTLSYD